MLRNGLGVRKVSIRIASLSLSLGGIRRDDVTRVHSAYIVRNRIKETFGEGTTQHTLQPNGHRRSLIQRRRVLIAVGSALERDVCSLYRL